MKKLLLFVLIAFTSCQPRKHRAYIVYTSYDKGWNRLSSQISCDSVKMFDKNHARVYIDGAATDVYAHEILISNN